MTAVARLASTTILTLGLQDETFAIPTSLVREILDMVPVTDVPSAPAFSSGLINVRGKVVPLVNLRVRFGMDNASTTIDSRIIVLEIDLDGEPTTVGLLADRVYEVMELDESLVEPTPRIGMRWPPDCIRGIGKSSRGFIIILDIDRIFSSGGAGAGIASAAVRAEQDKQGIACA